MASKAVRLSVCLSVGSIDEFRLKKMEESAAASAAAAAAAAFKLVALAVSVAAVSTAVF